MLKTGSYLLTIFRSKIYAKLSSRVRTTAPGRIYTEDAFYQRTPFDLWAEGST